MYTPANFDARPGDVAHVRSSTPFAWAIRRALPGVWGNHDAIVTRTRGEWGIAEALPTGFVVTPWSAYWTKIAHGKVGVAFLRPLHCPEHVSHVVEVEALKLAEKHVRYDWRAIAEIWARTVIGKAIPWNREWEWYCTEAVAACYANAGEEWSVWGKSLPTPYTTEKREKSGRLVYIGGLYGGPHYKD